MADQYWATGSDGKEYGPATLETVVQWIRQRRIVAQTQLRKNDGPWMGASQFAELVGAFSPAAPGAPAGALPAGARVVMPQEFRVWDFIGQAWELVRPHWLHLSAMFLILILIGCLPHQSGWIVYLIIGGPIMVGIWRAVLGMLDGRRPDAGMMFQGFDRFGEAFLANLVRSVLTFLGYLAFIVPGIILTVIWIFTFPIIGESGVGFWEAMRQSAVLTEGYRWRLFLLALANFLILVLGLLVLCVGVFVAAAVAITSFALAYRWLRQRKAMAGPPQAA